MLLHSLAVCAVTLKYLAGLVTCPQQETQTILFLDCLYTPLNVGNFTSPHGVTTHKTRSTPTSITFCLKQVQTCQPRFPVRYRRKHKALRDVLCAVRHSDYHRNVEVTRERFCMRSEQTSV